MSETVSNPGTVATETRYYSDGTSVTGTPPFPNLSPDQQRAADEQASAAKEAAEKGEVNVGGFPHHTPGSLMPRWAVDGAHVWADRIQSVFNGFFHLESGTRVPVTDEIMATGPARTGDFLVHQDGVTKLVAGADFQTSAMPIPHSIDAPSVSADPQPGFRPGEPASGSPGDPETDKPPLDAPAAVV